MLVSGASEIPMLSGIPRGSLMPVYTLRPMFSDGQSSPDLALSARDEREAIVLATIHAGPYGSELWERERLVGWVDNLGNYVDATEAPVRHSRLH